jgi:hypothetical protein
MENSSEEFEGLEALRECFGKLSITALGVLAAEEIFGEQLDVNDESLFLAAIIDETQPIQSELVAKLSMVFDMHELVEPDRYSFQAFKRKAGYSGKDKRLPKSVTRDPEDESDPDLYELGSYCLAICLKDYQIVKFGGEEHMLQLERMTPVFEIRPHDKKKPADRPSVPSNRTQIKLPNGKATLKTRDYLSVLVWAFWDGHPSKQDNISMNTAPLQEVIEKLGKSAFNQEIPQKSPPNEGIVIYDSVEEAKKEKNI